MIQAEHIMHTAQLTIFNECIIYLLDKHAKWFDKFNKTKN